MVKVVPIVAILPVFFFFQAEDGIRDVAVTGVQTCALPIYTFVANYLHDASSRLRLFALDGRMLKDLELPTLGSIGSISGERKDDEMFYAFTSFLYPTTIFRYDFKSGATSVFKAPTIDFEPSRYETKQVFYTSKDGKRVPMFITYKKGLTLDGSNPTYLYGYGGFDISLTPSFSVAMLVWLEMEKLRGRGVVRAPVAGRGRRPSPKPPPR